MFELIDSPTHRPRFRQLHEELRGQGFDGQGLERLLFEIVIPRLDLKDADPFWMHRSPLMFTPRHPVPDMAEIPSPLRLLIRLFHQNETVRREELEAVLSTSALATLLESGMMSEDGSLLTPNVSLTESYGLLIASDRYERNTQADAVFRPHPSTACIEWYLPASQPLARAVDIGTGSGILALLMNRRYGAEVHAIDPNERALEFCKLNMAINDIDAVHVSAGSHDSLAREPHLAGAVDLAVWNMPNTFWKHEALCWGFPSEGMGERVLAEVAGLLPSLLSRRGFAVLRHEGKVPVSWLDTLLRSIPGSDSLQALFFHEGEAAHQERAEMFALLADHWEEGMPGYEPSWVHGVSVVRRRVDPQAALMSFVPADSWEEWGDFRGERWQERWASLPGWSDYRIVSE